MMTLREATGYLDSFVNYEKKNSYPYRRAFKLERMSAFLARIGDPQDSFASIHVAGTKGKGSVSVFCSHILRASGLRTGLYTSPHLNDVRERIRVLEPGTHREADFEGMIPRADLRELVARLRPAIDSFNSSSEFGRLTFFEVYTALAFAYFRDRGVQCAVLETGLGGRLDATNVVDPVACCITPVSIDHTQKLGRTLARIAREKAGIIKPLPPGGCVISARQPLPARRVITERCLSAGAPLIALGTQVRVRRACRLPGGQRFDIDGPWGRFPGVTIRMLGRHQAENAACAAALAVSASGAMGRTLNAEQARTGFAAAFWPGRFEVRGRVVLDGAHNGASARVLADTLEQTFPKKKITFVLGVSKDKKIAHICARLRRVSGDFIVTASRNSRSLEPGEIRRCLLRQDPRLRVVVVPGIAGAMRAAARRGGICCVTGSLFLVGEARALLKKERNA
jgi:dihydrofolate synthase/folylpolyglutamate synthase